MRKQDCWYEKVCTNNCTDNCIRYLEMSFLMEHSGIPKNRQIPSKLIPLQCDLDAFEQLQTIKTNVVEFVSSGKNLFIYSDCTGNGKTSWAIKILLKYFDEVWAGNGMKCRGVFVHVPTFLAKLKQFKTVDDDFEEFKENILKTDLVVWDDIASTGLSAYDYSQLLSYIDTRTLNCLSNIFTSNLGSKNLEKVVGAKLMSRVWNSSTKIQFIGGDRR